MHKGGHGSKQQQCLRHKPHPQLAWRDTAAPYIVIRSHKRQELVRVIRVVAMCACSFALEHQRNRLASISPAAARYQRCGRRERLAVAAVTAVTACSRLASTRGLQAGHEARRVVGSVLGAGRRLTTPTWGMGATGMVTSPSR